MVFAILIFVFLIFELVDFWCPGFGVLVLGVPIFEVLVFGVLVFGVPVFGVLVFVVLVYWLPILGFLVFGVTVFEYMILRLVDPRIMLCSFFCSSQFHFINSHFCYKDDIKVV